MSQPPDAIHGAPIADVLLFQALQNTLRQIQGDHAASERVLATIPYQVAFIQLPTEAKYCHIVALSTLWGDPAFDEPTRRVHVVRWMNQTVQELR